MSETYTAAQVATFRKQGDVTPGGVAFDWWLVSIEGAGFCVIREAYHTDADIVAAKDYLQRERDVVGTIRTATIMNLTQKQADAYIEGPNVCPFCGSDDISGDEVDVNDREAWQDVCCLSCEAEWKDVYHLVRIEQKNGEPFQGVTFKPPAP